MSNESAEFTQELESGQLQTFMEPGMPILEVFNQEDEVKKREEMIINIEKDAIEIHQIAGTIKENIYVQGEKLDKINKNFEMTDTILKKANVELVVAVNASKKSNRCLISVIIIIIIVFLLVLGVVVYFTVFDDHDGFSPKVEATKRIL